MGKILEKVKNSVIETVAKAIGMLSQNENDTECECKTEVKTSQLLKRAAAEGSVLLKNDGVLPFNEGSVLSLFGRGQYDWFYTGYGSGGDVKRFYQINLVDGIRNCAKLKLNENLAGQYAAWREKNPVNHGFWGFWPRFYPEMPLDVALASQAARESDAAVIVIGRSSGEDRENTAQKGSYYLTDDERSLLNTVTSEFAKTVVLLNIGSIIDFSWIEEYGDRIGAVIIVWQGGMESGNAAAALLSGEIPPSGRLTDTAAREYRFYPSAADFGNKKFNNYTEDIFVGYRWFETFDKDKVLYPFGYGLSYTDFEVSAKSAVESDGGYEVECSVKNIGSHIGKEVVQLYIEKPCGKLGNPSRELAAFGKTRELKPGESQNISLKVTQESLLSYDSAGDTGFCSAWVREAGEYALYLGKNVRDAVKIESFTVTETKAITVLYEAAAPRAPFYIVRAEQNESGERIPVKRPVRTATLNLRKRIIENLPKPITPTGDRGIKLSDVKSGKATLEQFVAQLDEDELEALSRGDFTMDSPLGPKGNAGCFGGVTPSLREKGVPPVTTTDGPSGIRLRATASQPPISTALACAFDEDLVYEVYGAIGAEMVERGSDVLLAPGLNIHRNPLCGRNFEYYSEDPYLTGRIAVAAVNGLQSAGVSACSKHFACNNQEYRRIYNDSRVSERALREIYIKGFEMCVKLSNPKNLMTSYNKINGVWGHYHYELCTMIVREQWGYKGCIMTDWWMRSSKSPEFPKICDNGYRVRAGVNVFMPGDKRMGKRKPDGTVLNTLGKENGLTLAELQNNAMAVLGFVMQSSAFNAKEHECDADNRKE